MCVLRLYDCCVLSLFYEVISVRRFKNQESSTTLSLIRLLYTIHSTHTFIHWTIRWRWTSNNWRKTVKLIKSTGMLPHSVCGLASIFRMISATHLTCSSTLIITVDTIHKFRVQYIFIIYRTTNFTMFNRTETVFLMFFFFVCSWWCVDWI